MHNIKNKRPAIILIAISFFVLGMIAGSIPERTITSEMIASAEKIFGLEFTVAERDSMLDNLEEQLLGYQAIHKSELLNSDHFPLIFNPIPPDFVFREQKSSVILSDYSKTRMPDQMSGLAFYSIGELSQLIKSRKLTSVALTRFFIQRLKEYGFKLQAVVQITEETALKQAEKADAEIRAGKYRGPLHGIPYGVKDLFATKNYKTTWGSVIYKDQLLDYDADIVKKLEDAGAVLTAKLSMGELAWGDVWYGGKTRTPWDTSKGSSGSSAGSAACVGAGLLPFAIGTETWGSIVSPSTLCGVTGLRPTFGRVSRYGAMALSWSMDKVGPICRNAEDCIIVLNAISGKSINDPYSHNAPLNYQPGRKIEKLRIGYLKNDFEGSYSFRQTDSSLLSILQSQGIKLIPVELPDGYSPEALSLIISAESAALFDNITRTNEDDKMVRQIKNAWPNSFRSSRFIPAVEYINANRLRWKLCLEMKELFKDLDLIIVPSWQGNALLFTNLTGHPSLTVPSGFIDEKTPASITVIANLFDEGTLCMFGNYIQGITNFHREIPPFVKMQ